jgi:hypothetical protein
MPSLLCVLPMLSAPVLAPSAVRVAVRLTPRPAIQAAPAAVMEAPAPVLVPFRAVHDHEYWNQLGLDEVYHTYAAVLEVNGISPHQVLLERKIDDFSHKNAGDAIAAVAARFPLSVDASADSDLDASR